MTSPEGERPKPEEFAVWDHFAAVYRYQPSAPLETFRHALTGLWPGNGTETRIATKSDLLLAWPARTNDDPHATVYEDDELLLAVSGQFTTTPTTGSKGTAIAHLLADKFRLQGASFTKHLNGHFAILVNEIGPRRLRLIQDPFAGVRTLYWTTKDGCLICSDTLGSLLTLRPQCRQVDRQALEDYLKYSYIVPPATIYANVRQLPAGHMLVAERGAINTAPHDTWTLADERVADEQEALHEYRGVLERSLDRLRSTGPNVVYLLSGGLDSSVNVALASAHAPSPLTTVGVGAAKFNTDSPWAHRVSKLLGTHHHEYFFHGPEIESLPSVVWSLENLYYEPGVLLTYTALREAARHGSTLVGGECADQLFGCCPLQSARRLEVLRMTKGTFRLFEVGTRTICRLPIVRNVGTVRKIENRLLGRYDPNNWYGRYGFRTCDLVSVLRGGISNKERYHLRNLPDSDETSLRDYGFSVINHDYALYGILGPYGRLAEHLGIVPYSAYLDRDVFSFVLGLDHSLRTRQTVNGLEAKYLHRLLAKQLLPEDIVNRPKQGGGVDPYIHLEDGERLRAIQRCISTSPAIRERFRQSAVTELFSAPREHASRIMLLLVFDLWYHLHIERASEIPTFSMREYLDGRGGAPRRRD